MMRLLSRGGLHRGLIASVVLVCAMTLLVADPFPAQAVSYDRGFSLSPYASETIGDEGEALGVAREMTVAELVAAEPELDGTLVSFAGEAIGEPIDADDDHKWVNVSGGDKLVGVLMTNEQVDQITNYGAYDVKGSELQIAGTLNTSCTDHDGELDVHAAKVSVVSPGGKLVETESMWKYQLGGVLVVLGLVVSVVYYLRRRSLR